MSHMNKKLQLLGGCHDKALVAKVRYLELNSSATTEVFS